MKVLLGIGGSEDSERALRRVVERTAAAGDDLTVAVVENPDSDAAPDEVEARARQVLDDAGLAVRSDVDLVRLEGEPGPALVELAESGGFDQLVIGGGTRSPMGKISLGRIAEYVLLNGRVTVKLVR